MTQINKALEQKYLDGVRTSVATQKEKLDDQMKDLEARILQKQTDLKENRSQIKMDDIPGRVQQINDMIEVYDKQKLLRFILTSAENSPYFGKIRFHEKPTASNAYSDANEAHYVGKHGVQSEDGKEVIVSDWRAPISSLFYDYELGEAKYTSPEGFIEGKLTEKLQFKIEKGLIEWIINTSLTINDEVLQKALSENTSNNLRTIVATIQKKQNQIIRQGLSRTTVVQGVAGSGKTSIALHRIAFLLYNNRKNLTSNNILIFSPSPVFSSYISSILPELGEQNVKEICFDDIFKAEFGAVCNFETRNQQIERLLKTSADFDTVLGKTALKQLEFKNSLEFTEKLTRFLDLHFENNFVIKPVRIGKREFTAEQLESYIENRRTGSINDKIKYLAGAIVSLVTITKMLSEKGEAFLEASAYNAVMKMLKQKNIFKIYSAFLTKERLPSYNPTYLSTEDAIALLYIKNYIFGANADESIKHVVIDEMQDYNATALSIIKQMHNCPKTILGDFHQVVDGKFSEQKLDIVEKLFCANNTGTILRLERNYRASAQNNAFANGILGITSLEEPIRNGEKPTLLAATSAGQAKTILGFVDECLKKNYQSIGILTKTSEEAALLFSRIGKRGHTMQLILPKTRHFESGIVVAAAHLVKGLEFDAVIIADASKENYKTPIDRQSLYISATRALHKIYVVSTDTLTPFLEGNK